MTVPDRRNALDQDFLYTFTVFTPTFNRGRTLSRVYESLANQTFNDFEWLIVDDGSTDNTRELVEQWQAIATFPIHYHYQQNCGKHIAYNAAAQAAQGRFLICLDSDDACVPHTLERFKYHWDTIPLADQPRYSGIDCHCLDTEGRILGDLYPNAPIDSNFAEMRYRYKVKGEKWGFQRTAVIREFPFPNVPGVTHIPEAMIWTELTKKYPARYVNEPLRIYYENSGSDQLTKMNLALQNPQAYNLACKHRLDWEIEFFRYQPKYFLASAVNYIRSHLHLGTGLGQQVGELKSGLAKFLWIVALPLGYFFWWRDRLSVSMAR